MKSYGHLSQRNEANFAIENAFWKWAIFATMELKMNIDNNEVRYINIVAPNHSHAKLYAISEETIPSIR